MRTVLMTLLLVTIFLVLGCQGPQGPDGVGMESVDHTPPEVYITYPQPGAELITDEVLFQIEATDTLSDVEYVTLYVNGSNLLAGDSLISFAPPYQIQYNFATAGVPYGWFNASAKAVDLVGNEQLTPLVMFRRKQLVGLDTLSYYASNAEYSGGFLLPFGSVDDSTGYELFANYNGVRFTAPYHCSLVGLEIFFSSPGNFQQPEMQGITGPTDFLVSLYEPDIQGLPGEGIDSMVVSQSEVRLETWTYVDLTLMREDSAYTVEETEEFILLVRSMDEWSPSQSRGLVMTTKVILNGEYDVDEFTHRSLDSETGSDGRGWGTLLGHFPYYDDFNADVDKQDWMMRAIIDYGDGEVSYLYPSGKREPLSDLRRAEIETIRHRKMMRPAGRQAN